MTRSIIIAFVVIIIIAGIGYGNNRFFGTREVLLPSEEKASEIEVNNSDVTKEVGEQAVVQQESSKITENVALENATPNETDDWKTYRNEEYGFELQSLGKQLFLEEHSISRAKSSGYELGLNISIMNPNNLHRQSGAGIGSSMTVLVRSIEDFQERLEEIRTNNSSCPYDKNPCPYIYKETNLLFNNIEAIKINPFNYYFGGSDFLVLIKGEKYFYEFRYHSREPFDSILSTFKYIE